MSKLSLLLCSWQEYNGRGTSHEALLSAYWHGLAHVKGFDLNGETEFNGLSGMAWLTFRPSG